MRIRRHVSAAAAPAMPGGVIQAVPDQVPPGAGHYRAEVPRLVHHPVPLWRLNQQPNLTKFKMLYEDVRDMSTQSGSGDCTRLHERAW